MGSQGIATSSLLESLPPRPPTPPRETHHESAAPAKLALAAADRRLSLHTPPSIYSSADPSSNTNSTARGPRKKVGFSAEAEYKEPPTYLGDVAKPKIHHPTPVSLPSSSSKPVKSILKITSHEPNPLASAAVNGLDLSDPNATLGTMLESTMLQLSGHDRESKLDSYMMLTRALKTSNNLPDRVALQEQMGFFTQCIQRDLTAKTSEGSLDVSLINHALSLLVTFLYFPSIASAVSLDFAVFVTDHCIRSFEDSSIPKDISRHLMQIVVAQNFPPKVMTSDRVARLVSSLHKIEEHLKGKSIIMSRVLIYRKLIKQCKHHMVVHSDWLLDLFTDMLSSLKEIRSSATSLGLEAAYSISMEKQLSRKVAEILNLTLDDKKYIQFYEEKLETMAKDKQVSVSVPRIWSIVLLLLRAPLHKWESLNSWLRVIQTCFNSSDFPTKTEANYAWGRLVYLMHFEERSYARMIPTLRQPLETQLKRKVAGKVHEDFRRTVLGGICNLLYYTFKPNANLALLDGHWDNCVKPFMTQMLDRKHDDAQEYVLHATRILSGLFDCTTQRLWKEDRVVDDVLARPEELPAIDSKWIRHNSSRVFAVVGPILEKTFLALADRESVTSKLWHNLVGSVASAASKEIKVSMGTAAFVAHAFDTLRKVWQRGLSMDEEAEYNSLKFLNAVAAFLSVLINSLGHHPFTEKMFVMDKQNSFVPSSTPSNRPSKHQEPQKAALHHIFFMLSTLPPCVPDDTEFANFIASVFAPFFTSKSAQAQKRLAEELLSSVPMDTAGPCGPWLLVTQKVTTWLESTQSSHHSTGSSSEVLAGQDYRDAVKVLERGIRSIPNMPWDSWQALLYSLSERARDETGDAGVAIAVIEPLAKVALDRLANQESSRLLTTSVKSVVELLSLAKQPLDRQAVEAARRRLWGTGLAGSRSASFDPFDNLYRAVNVSLSRLYMEFDPSTSELARHLLELLDNFFRDCNPQLAVKTVVALQVGLAVWIQDDKRVLETRPNMEAQSNTRPQSGPGISMVIGLSPERGTRADIVQVKAVWDRVSGLLGNIEHPEQQLVELEPLLCAAFESHHRSTVNSAVSLWNKLFAHVQEVEYPEKLRAALLTLRHHADLVLPGLEVSVGEPNGHQPSFIDSQEEVNIPLPSARSSRRNTPRASSSRPSSSPTPSKSAISAKRSVEFTLGSKTSKGKRSSTTPRLRHNDSQIQFATIVSSPTTDQELESQLLTERQKEVRERQKETADLFPLTRSSPDVRLNNGPLIELSRPVEEQKSPDLPRAATPEPLEVFNDISTPTPRRGQLVPIPDHDMNDPPSSPPEPRRNPLANEIRSRSASNSLRDEWQFSSSPISGSPNPSRRLLGPPESYHNEPVAGVSLDEVDEKDDVIEGTTQDAGLAEPELPASSLDEDLVEDRLVIEEQPASPSSRGLPAQEVPETPQQPPSRAAQREETPKSDDEIFLDTFTSPQAPTPRRTLRLATASASRSGNAQLLSEDVSFEASDVDERSLLRLVVELDSGKVDRTDYRIPTHSPEDRRIRGGIVTRETPTGTRRLPPRRVKSSPIRPTMPSSQAQEAVSTASQTKGRAGLRKRKRGTSKAQNQDEGRGKKRKQQDADGQAPPIDEDAGHGSFTGSLEPANNISLIVEETEEEAPIEAEITVATDSMEIDEEESIEEQMAAEVQAAEVQAEDEIKIVEEDNLQEGAVGVIAEPTSDEPLGEEVAAARDSKADEIITLLRGGMDTLRSATLSREEVYKIEDIFMDLKRELYEAERRGRA